MRIFHSSIIIIILAVTICSCGYYLVGHGRTLPAHISSIGIPIFFNKTSEPNIDIILSNTIRDEFIIDGRLKVVGEAKADLLLKGKVTEYSLEPISFDSGNKVSKYWVYITASIELNNQLKKELRLKQSFTGKWDYSVSKDISDTDINRIEAIKEASKILAQHMISAIIEGF